MYLLVSLTKSNMLLLKIFIKVLIVLYNGNEDLKMWTQMLGISTFSPEGLFVNYKNKKESHKKNRRGSELVTERQ